VRYQYAAGALLQNITTPLGNHIGYQFDKGRISGITLNGQPLLTNIRSNALGQITGWSITLAGAAQPRTINRRFDANARMTASSLHAYQYDAAGRITHITGLAQSAAADQHHTLQYDSRDRLTRFVSTNGSGTTGNTVSSTTYRFDANGNRTATTHTTEAGSGASTTTTPSTTQADSNRLATLHQQVVPTDAAGNITAVDGVSLLHDPAGRISAVTSNRQATHYLHNAWGQRIYKGSTRADHLPIQTGTAYVYDEAGYLLGEYAAGSSTEYVWLPSDAGVFAVAVVHNGQVYAIEADHLDTPRRISNASNQTVWLWGYSGFGETGPQVTPDAPNGFVFNLRYPGQYFDSESGLFYNWHRSYDPRTGRYTQPDPIGLAGGWNRFVYAENNPIWAADPMGLQGATTVDTWCVQHPAECAAILGGTGLAAQKAINNQVETRQKNRQKTYQTYTRYNPTTGQCYSGRTSGYDSPETNVHRRGLEQTHLYKEGFAAPVLDRSSSNYSSIRGREQMLIDINGGAQSSGGTSRNLINGISPFNPAGPLIYMPAAMSEFGAPVPAGNCTCQ